MPFSNEPARWPRPEAQTALVVPAPEAEALVAPIRSAYDPAAAAGVPAHIAILFPFLSPDRISRPILERLRDCFAAFEPFDYALTALRRFPGVLYLAPEPEEPFRAMTRAIWRIWPETPPYEGKHADIVPHLSIAAETDEARLSRIAEQFEQHAASRLPIRARATFAVAMDNLAGPWRVTERFGFDGTWPFGPGSIQSGPVQ